METNRSEGPPEASRPMGPSRPPGAPLSLRSLVKTTRAQSLRERWNALKLQGFRGPPPIEAQGAPPEARSSLLQPRQTPRPRPVKGSSPGPSLPVGPSSPPRRVVSFLLSKKQSEETTEVRRPWEETRKGQLLLKHKNFGKVPKYLQVLREALLERQRNAQLAAQKETLAAAGVRRVSEEERQELLSILLQQKEKAEKELRGLPIALKTERQRLRSDELERLLMSLEKQLLKVMSKDLFVEKGDSKETVEQAASIPNR
ncbi:hypothetical protein Emag_003122 [Eimeria magna]